MKRIDDERIKFFLKHRQQIEEWLAVKMDLSAFAHEFYGSLREDIRIRVANDIVVGELSEPGNAGLFRLRRNNWPEDGPAVELGWWRRDRMDFSTRGGAANYLWCGLWADRNSPYWQYLHDAREGPVAEKYPELDQNDPNYVMYRFLPDPQGDLWEDDHLKSYGELVIQAVLDAWDDLAPLVCVDLYNP